MPTYSPGEIADKTGFSLDTLRYYERIGLLSRIDAIGEIDEVTRRALGALGVDEAPADDPADD